MATKPVKKGNKKPVRGNNSFREFKPRAELVTQINYEDGITVSALAEKLNKNSSDLIKLLFMLGKMVTINSNLDDETVQLICMEYNVEVTKVEPIDENS